MSHSLLSAATLALLINCASSLTIVGYFTDSNVTQHLRLDLDQTALNTAAQKYDFEAAYTAYSKGMTSHSPHAFYDMPERALQCTYCRQRQLISYTSA
jgi:predicted adenine nucleotide alpha hydrolase (AANH) superfamily ATPase